MLSSTFLDNSSCFFIKDNNNLKKVLLLLCVFTILMFCTLNILATEEPSNSTGSIGTDYWNGENAITSTGNDAAQNVVTHD